MVRFSPHFPGVGEGFRLPAKAGGMLNSSRFLRRDFSSIGRAESIRNGRVRRTLSKQPDTPGTLGGSEIARLRARLRSEVGPFQQPSTSPQSESRNIQQVDRKRALASSEQPRDNSIFFKFPNHFRVSDEVVQAISVGAPVVALETTIYTHGFPYPENVKLALDLEEIVRKNGAVPATIGIIDGVAQIGLNKEQLLTLTSAAGKPETMKVSRKDLPYIIGMGLSGKKLNGGTTVSGTMFLAHRVGIRVFGTGGLGGVHRGGQDTMDISADLTELGRTPVAVISSGCKSFLDIPRTLEYLETQGAGVFTFADSSTGDIDFPAFYTRDSGVKGPMVVQSAKEAAYIIHAQEPFSRSNSGLLFGNPIPEEFSIPKAEIDVAINQAVQDAADQGIHGHANTPFILARIKELTDGRSIPANTALIESNVAMAAKVAVELSKLTYERKFQPKKSSAMIPEAEAAPSSKSNDEPLVAPTRRVGPRNIDPRFVDNIENIKVLVFGSVAIDLSCDYTPEGEAESKSRATSILDGGRSMLADLGLSPKEPSSSGEAKSPVLHTSNVAEIQTSVGGVGYNVALAIQRVGKLPTSVGPSVRLCSLVGDDLAGKTVLATMAWEGLERANIITHHSIHAPEQRTGPEVRTAQYVAINNADKDLMLAMADMKIFNNTTLNPFGKAIEDPPNLKWVVVDANWNPHTAKTFMVRYASKGIKVAFEPVSAPKAGRIFKPSPSGKLSTLLSLGVFPKNIIHLATPNQHELLAMWESAKEHEHLQSQRWWDVVDAMGISSFGARDQFVSLTNAKMTDEGIPHQAVQLLPLIPTILTKLGSEGVLLTELLKPDDERLTDPAHAHYILSRCTNGSIEVGGVYMRLFPPIRKVEPENVVSVNGVGDTFAGVLIAGLANGLPLDEDLINLAQKGAVLTLESADSVSRKVEELSKPMAALVAASGNSSSLN